MPKALREQFNLTPGCELEIEAVANGITLRRADEEPTLVCKQGILIHHGSECDVADIGEFVRAERKARSAGIAQDQSSTFSLNSHRSSMTQAPHLGLRAVQT